MERGTATSATVEGGDPAPRPHGRGARGGVLPRMGRGELVLLTFFVVLPFVRAVVLWRQGWVPVGDNANIALRAQDVGTGATPLVGMPSGLGSFSSGPLTTHPGPLLFWTMAPWVRLFGLHPLTILVGSAAVGAAASAAILWCAHRVAGRTGTVAATAILVVIIVAVPYNLLQPLNPAIALLPALAALMAAASVLAGDDRSLPVLVVAGSFAAQAELAYTPVMAALAVVVVVLVRRSLDRRTSRPVTRRMWLFSTTVLVLCWLGPAIDVVVHRGGNVGDTMEAVGASDLQTQGPPALVAALRSVVSPWGWARWATPQPPPAGLVATFLGLGCLAGGVILARRALRRDRHVALALLTVAAVAVGATAVSQMSTPADAGRQTPYLLPVVAAGGFLWFVVLTLAAPWIRHHLPQDRRARVGLALVGLALALGQIGARVGTPPPLEAGSTAIPDLHLQARRSLPDRPVLLVPAGGPQSQGTLRGIGLRLEADGFEVFYPDGQENYVGPTRTTSDDVEQLLITRPLVGPVPADWRRIATWTPSGVDPDALTRARGEVANAVRREGPRFTHQSSDYQIGLALAPSSRVDGSSLTNAKLLESAGRQLREHPERIDDLSDGAVAALVEEGILRSDGIDPDTMEEFWPLVSEDPLELWLVPPEQ